MTNGRLRGGGPGERRILSRQVHPVGLGRRVGRGLGKRGGLHSVGRYEKRDGPEERRGILQCPPADCLPAHPRRPLKCNDVQDWPYQGGCARLARGGFGRLRPKPDLAQPTSATGARTGAGGADLYWGQVGVISRTGSAANGMGLPALGQRRASSLCCGPSCYLRQAGRIGITRWLVADWLPPLQRTEPGSLAEGSQIGSQNTSCARLAARFSASTVRRWQASDRCPIGAFGARVTTRHDGSSVSGCYAASHCLHSGLASTQQLTLAPLRLVLA